MSKKVIRNFERFILDSKKSTFLAIKKIQENTIKTLIIVERKNKLFGTLTDGDIRRGMLKGYDLKTPIEKIVNKKPIKKVIGKKLQNFKLKEEISILPCVDRNNKIKFIETYLDKKLSSSYSKNLDIVIMAGGFGKRLMPLTNKIPKPLIKINKKSIIELIIENFKKYGFLEFNISTFYKSQKIKKYFKKKKFHNLDITFLQEKSPMGTAGCLSLLNSKSLKKDILVQNGDVITDLNIDNLIKFHRDTNSDITVCAKEFLNSSPFGQISFKEHKIKKIIEKPKQKNFVNAGVYVISKKMIKNMKPKYLDMTKFIDDKINKNFNVNIYPIYEYWVDVGRKDVLKNIVAEKK